MLYLSFQSSLNISFSIVLKRSWRLTLEKSLKKNKNTVTEMRQKTVQNCQHSNLNKLLLIVIWQLSECGCKHNETPKGNYIKSGQPFFFSLAQIWAVTTLDVIWDFCFFFKYTNSLFCLSQIWAVTTLDVICKHKKVDHSWCNYLYYMNWVKLIVYYL